ncbi:hypothetical protein [Microtetraspora malaysiensis]|uniref:hypothetical protein n=1 Tax=Microtetraspora malaysiensis TaxID=161358 RepID=UPI003D91B71A
MGSPTHPAWRARTSGWGLGHWALLAAAVAVVLAVVTTVAWNLLDAATADGGVGNDNASAATSTRPLPLQRFSSGEGWSVGVPKSWKNDSGEYDAKWWSDPKGRAVLNVKVLDDSDSDTDPMAYLRKVEGTDTGSKYRRVDLRKVPTAAGQVAELDFTAFAATPASGTVGVKGSYRQVIRVISTGSSLCYLSWQVRAKDWATFKPTMQSVFKSFTAPS